MVKEVGALVDHLIVRLKRRTVVGSFQCALETLFLMRTIVSYTRWTSAKMLVTIIRDVGRRLVEAQPTELSVGNAIRRVLHLIKEDYASAVAEDPSAPDQFKRQQSTASMSMHNLLGDGVNTNALEFPMQNINLLKPAFIQAINELIDEIESIYHNISRWEMCEFGSEIIMTIGKSKTVEEFLKHAHRKRKFQVIVAEAAPWYNGQELTLSLSKAGIETTMICDSSIFAVMSRVNKVILGTHAVLANGGLIASSGSQLVAAAAKYHHVPVVVCTGLYKLSALQPSDEDLFNLLVRPDPIIKYEEDIMEKVDVINPFFDYVAPEFISLYITNSGGHAPSYIYRLLSESYDPEDYRLGNNGVDGLSSSYLGESDIYESLMFRRKRTPSMKLSTPTLSPAAFPEEIGLDSVED